MKKIISITACLAVMTLAIANVDFCYAQVVPPTGAKGITIGDEHVFILVRAKDGVGTYGKVSVPVIITDPKGRRIGYDPRVNEWFDEFDASYDKIPEYLEDWTEETEQRYNTDPEYREKYDKFIDITYGISINLIPGEYTIEAIGEGFIGYGLSIDISRTVKGQPEEPFTGFTKHGAPSPKSRTVPIDSKFTYDGVIDKGLASKFKFTYNPDPAVDPGTASRIATPSSLNQDIALSRKMGWIDNDGIMNSLLKKAEAIDASIAKDNKSAAKNQLEALIKEVDAQKDKHISSTAAKIIIEDAQYIMEKL